MSSSESASILVRAWRSYCRHGLGHVVRSTRRLAEQEAAGIFREQVRPRLPRARYAVWNEVQVARQRRWMDSVVPADWVPALDLDDPGYEGALVAALKEAVRPGDNVTVVGGGYGVTVVSAARITGQRGSVTCFEAAQERIADIHLALRLNRVVALVTVEHRIVSEAISLFGTAGSADVLHPADLPPSDILQLDCEGAEVEILRSLAFRPRSILVETHGIFGAPTTLIREILEARGYQVEDRGIAEERYRKECLENDIRVLVGDLRG